MGDPLDVRRRSVADELRDDGTRLAAVGETLDKGLPVSMTGCGLGLLERGGVCRRSEGDDSAPDTIDFGGVFTGVDQPAVVREEEEEDREGRTRSSWYAPSLPLTEDSIIWLALAS